jgi:hypothetical protein
LIRASVKLDQSTIQRNLPEGKTLQILRRYADCAGKVAVLVFGQIDLKFQLAIGRLNRSFPMSGWVRRRLGAAKDWREKQRRKQKRSH